MSRIVERVGTDTYRFSTSQEPRVEQHTLQQMQHFVEMCNNDIAIQEAERDEWIAKIAEAEALE